MEARLRVPSQNAEYCSVNAPWTYFFSPAGPDRSVVSSNPATADAVIRARISATTSPARPAALTRHEWMNPSDTPAPLHRDMLENHQVHRQRTEPGAGRQRGVRHARRARRHVRLPAGALRLVQ